MGLDVIEIVIEAEERFNVSLDDAECTNLRTVGDLAALVIAKRTALEEICPTQRAFYEFRRALRTVGVRRDRVRPPSHLDEVFTRLTGRTWNRLCAADRRLTAFAVERRPAFDALLWFALLGLGTVALTTIVGGCVATLLASLGVGIGCIIQHTVAITRRVQLKPAYATVGHIVRALAPLGPPTSAGERLARESEVLDEMRRITARCLNIPLEHVQARSDYVRDLGID